MEDLFYCTAIKIDLLILSFSVFLALILLLLYYIFKNTKP